MPDGHTTSKTLAGLLLKSGPPRDPEPEAVPEAVGSGMGQMDLLFARPAAKAPPRPVAQENRPENTGAERIPSPTRPVRGESTRRIWNVRALVADVRESLETSYEGVWVEGEISNCKPAPSGHIYFTLKDGDAQLSLVIFRRQAQLLRFAPKDGMEVLARGRISLFEARGQLQLIAETLEPRGAGSLQFAFEQLKARLLAEGLFDAARKRSLPLFPRCIGVITSTNGAVIHDIIRVVERRHASLDLLVYPAAVQGFECAGCVSSGIRYFNEPGRAMPCVDLILIARGGGSLEDLAGFNDEALARAIAASALPVVSAVGHETDFTIADFVADLRAPTPSAAAEMITAAQHRIEERLSGLADRVERAMRYQMMLARQRFTKLSSAQILTRVRDGIDRRSQRVDELRRRMDAAAERCLGQASKGVAVQAQRLGRYDPRVRLLTAGHRVERAQRTLAPAALARLARARATLQHTSARLAVLSPVAVLERGYALVYAQDGSLLRDAADAAPGQPIRARLAKGAVAATVVATEAQ